MQSNIDKKGLSLVPGYHSAIRSFMELLILCSIILSKSTEKSMNEHYRHSDMSTDTVFGDNNRKMMNIVIKLVKVNSHSVKLTKLGIIKCQPPTSFS